jgi:hypothetical protein
MFKKNTRYNHFRQKYLTAGDVDQFDKMVNLCDYDECISNTFNYMFHKFKKGIFIHIKDNKIFKFVPFCKANFVNEFSTKLIIDPDEWKSWDEMFNYIKQYTNEHNTIEINNKYGWWANNGLIRYEKSKYENDVGIEYIYNMITKALASSQIPDCTFFINKRDFPILKSDFTEPYHSIWKTETPLVSHSYNKYAEILSMTTSKNYCDIPIPTWDDYNREMTKLTVSTLDWDNKIDKAVFRGSSTGLGTTLRTNSRIKILKLAKENPKLLDTGITKWNLRPRKTENDKFYKTISKSIIEKYPIVQFLNYEEQSNYKFIINLPGHVSSFRLGTLLKLKSLILHVSNSQYYMWYEHLLKPYVHYVPLDKDLKNLISQIKWCQQNPKLCKIIIQNAYNFYKNHLTLDKQILFWNNTMQMCSNHYNLCRKDSNIPEYPICNLDTTRIKSVFLSNVCKNKQLYTIDDKYLLKTFVNSELDNYFKYIQPLEHSYMTNLNEYMGWRKIYGNIKYQNKEYIVLDYIDSNKYTSLYDYMFQSNSVDIIIIQDCLLQLCILLNNAYNMTRYIHNDCVPWNILISIDYQNPKTVFIQNGDEEYVYVTCCTLYLIDYEKGKTGDTNECRDIFNLVVHILFLILTNMYNYSQHVISMCINLFHDIFPNSECKTVNDIVNVLSLFKKYDNMTSNNLSSLDSTINLTNYIQFFELLQKHFMFQNVTKRTVFNNANNFFKQYLTLEKC